MPVVDVSPSQEKVNDQPLTSYIRSLGDRGGTRTRCLGWASSIPSASWPEAAASRLDAASSRLVGISFGMVAFRASSWKYATRSVGHWGTRWEGNRPRTNRRFTSRTKSSSINITTCL